MLRLTSSAVILCAMGFSAVVHAGALLVTAGHFGHSSAGSDDVLLVDLLTEPAPLEPAPPVEPAVQPPASRATIFPNHTHPYPVPASHDATPHDPNLVHAPMPLTAPAAAAPADTTTDDTPSFTIAIGPARSESFGKVSATGTAAPHDDGPGAVLAEQAVDTPARLVHGHSPTYPPAARADGIEGDVRLELIVDDGGTVESARVVRSVGHGLDEAALQAVRQFRFAPATKAGRAVHVRMGWSMQFRLQ